MNAAFTALMPLFELLPRHVCLLLCEGEDWRVEAHTTSFASLAQCLEADCQPCGLPLRPWLGRHSAGQFAPASPAGQLKLWLANALWHLAWRPTGPEQCCVLLWEDVDSMDMQAVESFSQELFAITNHMHDGLWVIDGQGITLHVNEALRRIAGIDPQEMIGKPVSTPLKEGKFSAAVTLEALEQKKIVTRFDDYPNGNRCLNTSTPIFDKQGKVWRVVACIRNISELDYLQRGLADAERLGYLQGKTGDFYHDDEDRLIATSTVMRRCMSGLDRAAKAPSGILILGETGTGKTYAASWIHQRSSRSDGPFIAVNCAAIPPSLIESELFGYDRGAFTGANRSGRKGYFELADKGTLLLDEIGELPLNMQAKILHVLDGQGFRKIGGEKEVRVDVRIIAATNRSLDQLVSEGSFRADLYYRLRVLSIQMPPLREHPEDIVPLMMFFLSRTCSRYKMAKTFSPRVIECFCRHSWPGNVRELKAAVEFLASMSEGSLISLRDLPSYLMGGMQVTYPQEGESGPDFGENMGRTDGEHLPYGGIPAAGQEEVGLPEGGFREAVEELERNLISRALREAGSTYKAAARLGISQSTVVRKARQLGIRLHEKKADDDKTGDVAAAGSDSSFRSDRA